MVAKIMKIFENYNTAKQKYGEELANSVLSNGIPNEYVYTACRYYTEDNIPIDVLQQKFRQWMSYIRNLGKETFNINNLSYQQFDNIIRDEIQKAMKPNPIYDDGTIFMGEFKTKEDALLYPIPNEWCTSNSSSKYNQYVGDGYRLFVIENKSLDEPLKYVCASVYNGRVIYWDVNDNQLYEDLRDYTNVNNSEHETYQRTLPKQIVDYLYNIAAEQTDEIENKQNINCNRNMNKKLIRLTESDLHRIVKESVNKVMMRESLDDDPNWNMYNEIVIHIHKAEELAHKLLNTRDKYWTNIAITIYNELDRLQGRLVEDDYDDAIDTRYSRSYHKFNQVQGEYA